MLLDKVRFHLEIYNVWLLNKTVEKKSKYFINEVINLYSEYIQM